MKLVYPVIFSPLENEKGFCVVYPDLPGAVTEGDSLENAMLMAVDCGCGWILDELEDKKPLPKASQLNEITVKSNNDFASLILLDVDEYAEKHGCKAVRKNCTIPAWLNAISESNNINFSAVLQEALIKKLHLKSE